MKAPRNLVAPVKEAVLSSEEFKRSTEKDLNACKDHEHRPRNPRPRESPLADLLNQDEDQ